MQTNVMAWGDEKNSKRPFVERTVSSRTILSVENSIGDTLEGTKYLNIYFEGNKIHFSL